jgi:hypothetical protein
MLAILDEHIIDVSDSMIYNVFRKRSTAVAKDNQAHVLAGYNIIDSGVISKDVDKFVPFARAKGFDTKEIKRLIQSLLSQ